MPQETRTFVITDPRSYDGDCFEVADRAAAQAEALAGLLEDTIRDAFVMARNAEMERQIIAGNEPDAAAFENGPHGKAFEDLSKQAKATYQRLGTLRKAASFNPKAPLDG